MVLKLEFQSGNKDIAKEKSHHKADIIPNIFYLDNLKGFEQVNMKFIAILSKFYGTNEVNIQTKKNC